MIFLATPHRGSSHATYLNNLLRVSASHGTKLYVSDLERVSASLIKTNDTFRHYCDSLTLYSFFETKGLSMGATASAVIVPKDSAVMGLPGERVSLMYADHRSICKFETPEDPGYIMLTEAFNTINMETSKRRTSRSLSKMSCYRVADAVPPCTVSTKNSERLWGQLRQIEAYLGMPEVPEDDLKDLDDISMPGSCDWFTDREAFQTWLSTTASSSPRLYWVYAKPAAGKSVLASHVIRATDGFNNDCSYYFFRHGDKVRSTLSGCLLSLAYQMAIMNVHVRSKLLLLIDRGVRFERDNAKSIWRKVVEPILINNGTFQPQYWILDALDECSDISSFFTILSKLDPQIPVKIFVTSRRLESITAGFAQLEKDPSFGPLLSAEIQMQDTRDSVHQYLRSNQHKIHAGTEQERADLIIRIIDRAQGCFLWVRLVLEELSTAWTMSQIERVLSDVPQEMDELYSRAVELLLARPAHSVIIAKAILTWTICAIRPLTTAELQSALQLDIGTTVQDPEDAIPSLCCQLVHVDKNGRVLIVHLTARTFLQERGLESSLTFCPIPGHQRVLRVCLGLLNSDAMKPPKARRGAGAARGGARAAAKERASNQPEPALLNYAAFHFAEHMRRTTSNNEIVSPLLHEFLGKNVFTWIEFLAKHSSLDVLTRTADMIKNYYQRQSKYFPPLGEQVQLADAWTVDLHRLVAKFGTILVRRPSSIHSLIPPFCPGSSAVSTVFGKPLRRIQVVGIEDTGWDDRLSCIDSGGPQCYAVASGEGFFAVGFGSSVVLHDAATCQRWKELKHGDVVRHLGFDRTGNWLVSAGRRSLKVWDLEGGGNTPRFAFSAAHDVLTISLQDEADGLIAALKNHTTVRWSLESGEVVSEVIWRSAFADEGKFRRPPLLAAFSPDESILAIVYRGRPIVLWDLAEDDLFGLVGRESQDLGSLPLGSNTSPSSLVFHPDESVPLLVAAYEDGDLCLFDYDELQLLKMMEANAQIVACSPDGTILATGNSAGMVQLLAFETLQLLFRVNAVDYGIRDLAFSADNLRLIDARGTQCNVWEPSLPSGRARADDASSNWAPTEPRIVGLLDGEVEITTMATEESSRWFFVGKSDGSVWLYRTSDGKSERLLYRHGYDMSVELMAWGDSGKVLATADSSGRFIVSYIARNDATGGFADPIERIDIRRDIHGHHTAAISQLLLNKSNDLLLVSTAESDAVWDLNQGVKISTADFDPRPPFRWANNPLDETERVLIGTASAEVWDWKSCKLKIPGDHLRWLPEFPATSDPESRRVKCVSEAPRGGIFVEYSDLYSGNSTVAAYLLHSRHLQPGRADRLVPSDAFTSVIQDLAHFIGICGSKLFFLDKRFGICSIDFLDGERPGFRHVNHCFIPNDWCNRRGPLRIHVTGKGDILFARTEEVAVVKHAVAFEDERREAFE
jgi:WD40 repeat protein